MAKLVDRRRAMRGSTAIKYKWITLQELVSFPNAGQIPIYAHACSNSVGTPVSHCRICMTYSPNNSVYYQANKYQSWDYPSKPTLRIEGYESPARIAFGDYAISYDSGWLSYTYRVDKDGTSLRGYYNNDASKLHAKDIFGPAPVYFWGYQFNAPLSKYYVLIQE